LLPCFPTIDSALSNHSGWARTLHILIKTILLYVYQSTRLSNFFFPVIIFLSRLLYNVCFSYHHFTSICPSFLIIKLTSYVFRLSVTDLECAYMHTCVRRPRFESRYSGYVYRNSHCDIQPWAWAVHLYCNAYVDSAFHCPWDGKMCISLRTE